MLVIDQEKENEESRGTEGARRATGVAREWAETKFVRSLIQVRMNDSRWPFLMAEDLLSSLLLSLAPSFEYASQAECRWFAPGLGASQFGQSREVLKSVRQIPKKSRDGQTSARV